MNGFRVKSRRMVADVEVNLTPREWQLFSMGASTNAALTLNAAALVALREPTREDAWKVIMPVMETYADCGACDTEPRSVFSEMLDEVYGRDW